MSFRGSTFGRYSGKWLIIVGVFELALAGFFVFLALSLPSFAAFGMWLTAGILGATGLVLVLIGLRVRSSAEKVDQLLATGLAGTAQVTGVTQTGMYLNEQPQIELDLLVTLPNRPPYAAKHKSFVPMILLGRVTSGLPLPVRVDPADPERIAIDWQNAGFGAPGMMPMTSWMPQGQAMVVQAGPMAGMQPMQAMPMQPMQGMPIQPMQPMRPSRQAGAPGTAASGMDESLGQIQAALAQMGGGAANVYASAEQGAYTVEQLRTWLRSNGQQTTARVDKLEDSGKLVGDERIYTIGMTLNIPGGDPQKLPESAAMVPLSVSHKLFQGMTVPVRYAAENPNLLMVEWDKV